MPRTPINNTEYNNYIKFMLFLNSNRGYCSAIDPEYFDFVSSIKVFPENLARTVLLGTPIFKQRGVYILHRQGKDSKVKGGEFWLTHNGMDIVRNEPREHFPAFLQEPIPTPVQEGEQQLTALDIVRQAKIEYDRKRKEEQEKRWTKEEVVHLLTNEAHMVGRMLGTGYDLLEPIHSEWIKTWVLNPQGFRVTVHQAHRDSFKCFSPETKVLMYNGTTKMIKNIAVGEYVMGWDSTPRKVIGRHSGNTDMYKVTLKKNGEYYICNKNHILTLRQRGIEHNKRHKFDKYRLNNDNKIIDIPVKDWLKISKKGDREAFSHFKVGVDFQKNDTILEIPPYILGCWLGDGTSQEIAITTADMEIRNEFKVWATSYGLHEKCYTRNKSGAAKTYKYFIDSYGKINPVRGIFKKYNLLGNKHIPHEYITASRSDRLELLAGLLDTDGSFNGSNYTYISKKQALAKQVEFLARSLGFNATVGKYKTWCTYKGNKKESFAFYVYINAVNLSQIPVRLKRKKAPVKKNNCRGHLTFNQDIEYIGKGDFVGIEIEGDGKFLLDNFLVVHNTTCLRLTIAIIMILNPLLTIIIIRKSEDAVKEIVNGVSKILDTPLFQTFINILHPDIVKKGGFKKTTDTALSIDTNLNTSLSGEFQLRGLGLGSPLTGKHAALIITDDIVTTDDRESEAERRSTIAKYQELMNILSNNKGFSDTRILNIGTPWHEEDAFALMERGLKEKSDRQKELEEIDLRNLSPKEVKAIKREIRQLNMLRGLFVYNCYQTGLMTKEDIEWKKRVLNDDALFQANYMLSLVSDAEKPFPKIKNVGNYSKTFYQNAWEVFAAIDAAYSGDDRTAVGIGACNWETNEVVVYGRMYKTALDKNYMEVAEVLFECGVSKIFMETNTDKGLMGDKFRELGFVVDSYHESMNKHTKIVSTIRPYWREEGQELLPAVQFVEETDEEYLKEVWGYKKGVKHDDAPDNLACLLLKGKFGSLAVRVS